MDGKTIKNNKFASFKYKVDKKYEAGIVLSGKDVKAIRGNLFDVRDAFVREDRGELYLWNIAFFDEMNNIQKRKLLLNRREIDKIVSMFKDKKNHGFVLSVRYNEKNKVKFDIGIGTLRKKLDKKTSEKRSSEKRELEKMLKNET